ncbi:hypothetical protein [Fodinibius sp. AD559]|uniref:hypothetical protein n=1 Tax=Fodinibius sp. AD559 TaxID=3424179 RepID=UPI004046C36E
MSEISDLFKNMMYEVEGEISEDFSPRVTENYVAIDTRSNERELRLVKKDLEKIYSREFPKKRELQLYPDCGFSFNFYGEFLIDVHHPDLIHLTSTTDRLPTDPLQFKIDDVLIEVGPASDLFIFLFQPKYRNGDIYPDGFSEFGTLKILNCPQNEFKDYVTKGLYYFNSYYLKRTNMVAHIEHFVSVDDENYHEFERFNSMDIDEVVGRTRVRARNNFHATEPLELYNYAITQKGDDQFLAFYRILEFFFNRYKKKRLEELRFDKNISEQKIIEEITLIREEQYIVKMLNWSLTDSMQKKLYEYAFHHSLITSNSFSQLCSKLYEFRNSIVHAKESELDKTQIPDPFQHNSQTQNWIFITKFISERLIKDLNEINV